jgi:hypothetical protein
MFRGDTRCSDEIRIEKIPHTSLRRFRYDISFSLPPSARVSPRRGLDAVHKSEQSAVPDWNIKMTCEFCPHGELPGLASSSAPRRITASYPYLEPGMWINNS